MSTNADAAIEIRRGNYIGAANIYDALAGQAKMKRRTAQAEHYMKLAAENRSNHEKITNLQMSRVSHV